MAHLILVRHAKAIDRMDADDDFERGLTPRGREDAARAGVSIARSGLRPDLALVSPAQRTLQTHAAMQPHVGDPPRESPMALYHASPDLLRRAVTEALTHAQCILLVGHNPGIGSLALDLAFQADAGTQMPDGYPTASATVFKLPDDSLSRVELVSVFDPKQ
tara:strand:- start:5771 stop:6256 length:486 start_codon:yes stop_codon:yes gene_type:complete